MDISKEVLSALDEGTKAKVAACETPEDIIALAKDSGVELSDAQLDSISGGSWSEGECYDCGFEYYY